MRGTPVSKCFHPSSGDLCSLVTTVTIQRVSKWALCVFVTNFRLAITPEKRDAGPAGDRRLPVRSGYFFGPGCLIFSWNSA